MRRQMHWLTRPATLVLWASLVGTACAPEDESSPGAPAADTGSPFDTGLDADAGATTDVGGGSIDDVGYEAPTPTMRRLSRSQYSNAIRDLFGEGMLIPSSMEPDALVGGYIAVGASSTSISARGVEQYEAASYQIAAQVLALPERPAALTVCTPGGPEDAGCASQILAEIGEAAWRRPLDTAEVEQLTNVVVNAATTLGSFDAGLEFGIAALLQSPNFLFRIELGEPDPANPAQRLYTSWELASRLSFLLWNTIPDEELRAAAADGSLSTPEGLQAQAERLLASPRAREGVRALFSEALELYKLDRLSKDPLVFSHMSPTVGASAREETLQLIESLVFATDADFRDLLTSRQSWINRELAAIYSVRAPVREGFGWAEAPDDSQRIGFLGQVSFLALASHPVSSSPTLRGEFVRERLLCEVIAPPPAGVDTSIPEPTGTTRTLRERVAEHLQAPECAGCHQVTDPIGLGLENFDGIGRFRTTDNGAEIDASGDLDGVPFTNAVELAMALRDHPRFGPCMVRHIHRFANGRIETAGERALLRVLSESFAADGYRVRPLLLTFVTSPAFTVVGALE